MAERRSPAAALRRAFYERNRLNFAAAVILQISLATFNLAASWILGEVLDAVTAANAARLRRVGVVMAACVPVFLAVYILAARFKARFVHRAMGQYKQRAFGRLMQKRISAFREHGTAAYLSALTNDAASVELNYLDRAVELVYCCLQFSLALTMMLLYSWRMTLAVLALSVLPIAASVLLGGGLTGREQAVAEQNGRFTDRLKDLLNGFEVIKSFRAEGQALALFDRENAAAEGAKERRQRFAGLVSAVSGAAGITVQFGIFLIGAVLALRGEITVGTVVVFVNLCNSLIQPISALPEYLASRRAARALTERLATLLQQEEEPPQQTAAPFEERISLRGVTFGYDPQQPVLHDLSCDFEKGKSYAVVGASGSGKSTLLGLLTGTLRGYGGRLTLDGREISTLSADSLYGQMSLISQQVFLFDDTVRNNITMFAEYPEAAVARAIRLAGLEPVIRARGEDYRCGENGAGLSGGERQRIAIARSLLKGAGILLADEATAALDNETAQRVSEALLDIDGLTRIVVTHRLDAASLRRYDSILMLKNGAVCEQGAFDELMARRGQFHALYTVSNG